MQQRGIRVSSGLDAKEEEEEEGERGFPPWLGGPSARGRVLG